MQKFLVTLAGLAAVGAKATLKCGGPIQTTGVGGKGKMAWDALFSWVNTTSTKFTVELEWMPFGNNTVIEKSVQDLTDPAKCAGGKCVELLIPPYGSTHVLNIIDYIHADWDGVLISWGGASDTIFTKCAGKKFKCFGTFTVGSKYMTSGLEGLNAKSTADLKVAVLDNTKDAFATSVCKGAKDYISATAGLTLAVHEPFSGGDKLTATEKTTLDSLHTQLKPDVWAVCGKTTFVAPVVEILAVKKPEAILGTNIITSTTIASYANAATANCLLMPTQWAGGAEKDSITGYTTASFKTKMGAANAGYHAASAAAAAIAVIHAMETSVGTLASRMANVDTKSFYGHLKFNSDGSIVKPMYTQQRLAGVNQVVLPESSSTTGTLKPDYSQCKAGTATTKKAGGNVTGNGTTTMAGGSSSDAATARVSVVAAAASALVASAW